jgi:hypothetical protein
VEAHCGFSIVSIPVPCPTCANDTLLLTDLILALQAQLTLTSDYANMERYNIQLAKTPIAPMNIQSKDFKKELSVLQPWQLNGDQFPILPVFKHVGIQRNSSPQPGYLSPGQSVLGEHVG